MSRWQQWQQQNQRWKVWVDGSFCEQTQQAALAAIIKDPQGNLCRRKIARLPGTTSTHAELLAVRLGIQTLQGLVGMDGLQQEWDLYCDCKSIPEILNGHSVANRTDQELIEEIRSGCGAMKAQWVPRKQNRDADQCAQRAHRLRIGTSTHLPRYIHTAQERDQHDLRNRMLRAGRKIEQRQRGEWKCWKLQQSDPN
jgi:ribonuclease HI